MIDLIVFTVLTISVLVLSALIFALKDVLHAAIALASLFLFNSLFFLLINQPLLAVVQLFIMVGGIATFLFVGVGSAAYSKFWHTKKVVLVMLWAALFVALASSLNGVSFTAELTPTTFWSSNIASSLQSSAALFYVMALAMFGVSLGAIILLKKTKRNVKK
ncbi:MAG: hypothetical protein LVQ95_03680 [Candidatus Micrarchaeales archaeon]|nr:hypothetical protein [Candidatus Micrarchaeales archaeon]